MRVIFTLNQNFASTVFSMLLRANKSHHNQVSRLPSIGSKGSNHGRSCVNDCVVCNWSHNNNLHVCNVIRWIYTMTVESLHKCIYVENLQGVCDGASDLHEPEKPGTCRSGAQLHRIETSVIVVLGKEPLANL